MQDKALKTEEFRAEFRLTVPQSYSGLRHGAIILSSGVLVIAICLALVQSPLRWFDWAMVPLVILIWNYLEWIGHKALHRPGTSTLSRALYKRHALTHHRFFTHETTTLRDARDLKIVFFPAFVLPALVAMAIVPCAILWWAISRNAALVAMISWVGIYLLFEFFHLCAHLPSTAWVTRLPIVSTMCRHHRAHHNPTLMATSNMNFTLPWADWLFGTSDLDRGFWGTTFNGWSEQFARARKK